jgi:hypothetical protein
MDGFFACIIFLGILIVISSVVFILIEKRKDIGIVQKINDKSYDLSTVLEDAEHMIEEMDKFSDYIMNKISDKQAETEKFLKEYTEKAASAVNNMKNGMLNKEIESEIAVAQIDSQAVVAKKTVEKQVIRPVASKQKEMYFAINSDIAIESSFLGKASGDGFEGLRLKEKVIPLNSRHKDILVLSSNGLSNTEIAKRLNVGKGEIELILGINK